MVLITRRDRSRHDLVALLRQAIQQNMKRGQRDHEERRIVKLCESFQGARYVCWNQKHFHGAVVSSDFRSQAVQWKISESVALPPIAAANIAVALRSRR